MASRKDEKEQRKQERLRREEEAKASERRRRVIGIGVAGALVLAVIVAIVIVVAAGGDDKAPDTKDLKAKAAAAGCTFHTYPNFGRQHTTAPVKYKTNPPTSGNHFPVPASDNAYIKAPKTEALVHSLEHGRIIYQYQPKAPANVKDALNALYHQNTERTILVPNETNMPSVVAVTAWRHSITCPKFSDQAKITAAFAAFRDAFRDKGPEYIPQPE
jgi:hypothetical protein